MPNSSTNYTIYLKNESSNNQNFWAFLERPEGLSNKSVYANSSAFLSVDSNDRGINSLAIPLQYSLGAGAAEQPVGLGVQIDSSIILRANLKETWETRYATIPPRQGPNLNTVQGHQTPDNSISLITNSFDKAKNEDGKWYSNSSFGIQTEMGFLGVTWSPSPDDQCTITPKFSFYIATGNFSSYELADLETISRKAAKIELSDFRNQEVTVTLTNRGQWIVESGKVLERI
ncbi:hypothetical protein CLU81_1981 [Flavobacterium sp. 9]|uniref:hypothetical protein n=1 Tax=Flavobacterium sp. 9 TaxID=2035198 RepID=UPI000C18670A|nr:hypothetical protein [Flavobacterium sp. 9]PIF31491.1 hypothetical protein CLU81_1981 [Flavobacterium sp. 9]